MSLENKHLEHLAAVQALTGDTSWSSWGSPVGLSIFFLTLTGIAAIIKIVFFG